MFLLTGGPGLLPFLTWRYYSDARAIGRSGRCRFLASRPEWKPLQWEWKPARIRDFHGIWMYSNGIQLGLMMVSLIWFSTKLAQKILVTSWDGKKNIYTHGFVWTVKHMIFQPQPEDCQDLQQTGGDTPSNMTRFTSISFAFNCKSTFIHNININRYDDVSWQSHPLVFHKIARKDWRL